MPFLGELDRSSTDVNVYLVSEGDLCRQPSQRDREGQEAQKVCLPARSAFDTLVEWSLTELENYREHGNKVIGEVTLDQVYGGARGIKSLVWEVSSFIP